MLEVMGSTFQPASKQPANRNEHASLLLKPVDMETRQMVYI